jgi:selenocysteine lyase/cysteine desulfurase
MLTRDGTWSDFRRQMPVAERWAYFDHAAVAPLPAVTRDVVVEWAEDLATNGDVHWPRWRERLEGTRRLAAQLIWAEPEEIALIRNTTEGVNLVAEGFPWQAGDNVVLPAGEFPTNLYPWLNLSARGVEVRRVPVANERLDLDRLAESCDGRTRIVSASWVGYATGWRNDVAAIAEIAHRRGALFFLDAIQGMGVFPLEVRAAGVDFLAADGHKWMLGPEGAGVFFVRRELLERLRPLGVGWNSVRHAGNYTQTDLTLKENAGRYEGGSYNMAGLAALGASLKLLLDCGIPAIAERVLEITDELCERLQAAGAEIASCREDSRRSGIVAFTLGGVSPMKVKQHCLEREIALTVRAGRVRLSPHAYADERDLERLIDAIESVSRD